jgi:hypothetical protein
MLTLATIGIMVSLVVYSGSIWYEVLPAGEYPAILLATPGLLIGILFFAVGAVVLKKAGLPAIKTTSPV